MRYSITVKTAPPPEPPPFTTSGCEMYVATHKETGETKFIVVTFENIILFDVNGYISHGSKAYVLQAYIIRKMTPSDSLTIQGK